MEPVRKALTTDGPAGNAVGSSALPVPSSTRKRQAVRGGMGGRPSVSRPARPSLTAHSSAALSKHHESKPTRRNTLAMRTEVPSGQRGDGGMYGRTPQASRVHPAK